MMLSLRNVCSHRLSACVRASTEPAMVRAVHSRTAQSNRSRRPRRESKPHKPFLKSAIAVKQPDGVMPARYADKLDATVTRGRRGIPQSPSAKRELQERLLNRKLNGAMTHPYRRYQLTNILDAAYKLVSDDYFPPLPLWTRLITLCAEFSPPQAHKALHTMITHSSHLPNTTYPTSAFADVMSAYSNKARYDIVRALHLRMIQHHVPVTANIYAIMIEAAHNSGQAESEIQSLINEMFREGITPNAVFVTAIMKYYHARMMIGAAIDTYNKYIEPSNAQTSTSTVPSSASIPLTPAIASYLYRTFIRSFLQISIMKDQPKAEICASEHTVQPQEIWKYMKEIWSFHPQIGFLHALLSSSTSVTSSSSSATSTIPFLSTLSNPYKIPEMSGTTNQMTPWAIFLSYIDIFGNQSITMNSYYILISQYTNNNNINGNISINNIEIINTIFQYLFKQKKRSLLLQKEDEPIDLLIIRLRLLALTGEGDRLITGIQQIIYNQRFLLTNQTFLVLLQTLCYMSAPTRLPLMLRIHDILVNHLLHSQQSIQYMMIAMASSADIIGVQRLAQQMKQLGIEPTLQSYNAIMQAHLQHMQSIQTSTTDNSTAATATNTATDTNTNAILKQAYITVGLFERLLSLMRKRKIQPNELTHAYVLRAYSAVGDIARAERYVRSISTAALPAHPVVQWSLMDMYLHVGLKSRAAQLYCTIADYMHERNTLRLPAVMCHVLLRGFAKQSWAHDDIHQQINALIYVVEHDHPDVVWTTSLATSSSVSAASTSSTSSATLPATALSTAANSQLLSDMCMDEGIMSYSELCSQREATSIIDLMNVIIFDYNRDEEYRAWSQLRSTQTPSSARKNRQNRDNEENILLDDSHLDELSEEDAQEMIRREYGGDDVTGMEFPQTFTETIEDESLINDIQQTIMKSPPDNVGEYSDDPFDKMFGRDEMNAVSHVNTSGGALLHETDQLIAASRALIQRHRAVAPVSKEERKRQREEQRKFYENQTTTTIIRNQQ